VTFTAQWTPVTYTLTYDANGGRFNSDTNNPTSATYDQSHNITTPVRHGYNFTTWTVSVNNGAGISKTVNVNYPSTSTNPYSNETTTNGATVKYTANWSAVTYNINFDYDSSTNTNDSTTATFASWKNIANPERMGYLFDYWEITGTSACGHTANCGCFTSADSGTCSHYYNNSNSDTNQTRFTGESLAKCTATYYKNLYCTQGGTVTFKAHWIKKTYNVINAGAVYGATISTEYPKYDDVFSMTEPTSAPTGYHFNGWTITGANEKDENTDQTVTHIYGTTSSPSSTFTGTSKTVGKTVMYFKNLSSNHWTSSSSTAAIVTITPVWAENTYTITFDMNNPNRVTNDITSMSNITAYYDTAYNVANPTKAGYTFEGWSISGLTTDCKHYYGNSSTSMTAFDADPNGAYKDSETAQYVLLKNTYYKNLRSEEGNAVLKANWKAVTYTITYHYIPASFNVANFNASQLFTHVVIPKNMTATITKQVVYDTKYEAIDAKNELGEVIFPLPAGLKFKLWTISDSVLGNNVQIAKYNSSNVVVTNLSDSILPGEKRIYGPGKDSDGELTWKHYSKDIHLYACYDLAGINLRYYGPSAASGENDLSKYSNLSAINTNVKYTEFIRFASHAAVVDGVNLMGWMISADYFSSGKLTEQSVTVFEYKSEKYIAYQGTQAYWNYTNVDAYSYEDPTYFLYAVYSSDYSGSTHALDFTYRDNSSGSFGAMHSAKFYSVRGTDNTITTVKIPKIYNDGANGWWPVELIDAEGFKGYTKLTSATWFNTMRRLDDYAFSGCTKLATFTLNEGLHTIGAYAFNGCTIITSISTPSTLRVVGNHAFRNCINVSSLSLNTGLLTIGDYAFYNLPKVTSLTLPSTLVGKIGTYAFYYIQMASVTIPKGVTILGYGCFYQCTKLATITFAEGSSLKKIEGNAFDSTIITSINIPNSVTQIDHNAFYSCAKLETVTLPDSLTTLGQQVFYNCAELTAITIPKGLTSIPNNTFYGCAKLNSVTIYNGITSIGETAFYNCSSLTSLTIPNTVTSIGSSAFYGCSKLATLSVPFVGKTASTTTASEYIFGYIFGASGSSNNASYVPTTLKTVHITNATKVDVSAFNGLTMLTHLYSNKGVTSIGQNAFNGCTGLVELSIPFVGTSSTDTTYNFLGYFFGQTTVKTSSTKVPSTLKTVHVTNATSIGYCAFYYAPVTTVNLNEGITSIGQYAFSNSKITGINLPRTVTTIENYAFYYASDLATVNFNEGLTSIGVGSFWESKISTVVIPQTVTTIGTYAFRN
ncbi:MAG: leucine-rich repeat protein, partial [Clostridia bacterium]|nr:leucine-rich repeat protein [Clostridia bacterium]